MIIFNANFVIIHITKLMNVCTCLSCVSTFFISNFQLMPDEWQKCSVFCFFRCVCERVEHHRCEIILMHLKTHPICMLNIENEFNLIKIQKCFSKSMEFQCKFELAHEIASICIWEEWKQWYKIAMIVTCYSLCINFIDFLHFYQVTFDHHIIIQITLWTLILFLKVSCLLF